jgi:hypothetical protein
MLEAFLSQWKEDKSTSHIKKVVKLIFCGGRSQARQKLPSRSRVALKVMTLVRRKAGVGGLLGYDLQKNVCSNGFSCTSAVISAKLRLEPLWAISCGKAHFEQVQAVILPSLGFLSLVWTT